ncbi:hypothetical protein AVEN_95360-2 [Araneus ventricosus]|uniref:Uncharacterized protein n=1 Tax=Araneus ventricosus TaxID=182803 RepID=A0A4Y2QNU8_ARAVE|nr:hypothetical protein AVEN_95360-2 [Araneus ventricosus]
MMRTTPELTPHLQTSFYTTPAGGRLAATYDLKCNRPTTRQENQWNLVWNLEACGPEVDILPLNHHAPSLFFLSDDTLPM